MNSETVRINMKGKLKTILTCMLLAGCIGAGYTYMTKQSNKDFSESKKVFEEDSIQYYGYHCLNDREKEVYLYINDCVKNMDSKTSIPKEATEKEISNASEMVRTDHPEYFWYDGFGKYNGVQGFNGTPFQLWYYPEYNIEKSQKEETQQQIDDEVENIKLQIPSNATPKERVEKLYQAVCNEAVYNKEASNNQNIKSVFVNHETVCAGYAKGMQYLLRQYDIPCIYVRGVHETESHAWNRVYVDGVWYWVDPTAKNSMFCLFDDNFMASQHYQIDKNYAKGVLEGY